MYVCMYVCMYVYVYQRNTVKRNQDTYFLLYILEFKCICTYCICFCYTKDVRKLILRI